MYQIFQNKFCLLKLNLKQKNAKKTPHSPYSYISILIGDNDIFFHYISFTLKNKKK